MAANSEEGGNASAQVLALTDEDRARAEKAKADVEAARRAAEEKLASEAEARRRRDAERVRLQVAGPPPGPPPGPAGPSKEQLEAAATKVGNFCKQHACDVLLHVVCMHACSAARMQPLCMQLQLAPSPLLRIQAVPALDRTGACLVGLGI